MIAWLKRIYTAFTQTSTTTRRAVVAVAALIAAVGAFALWYRTALKDNGQIDKDLTAMREANQGAARRAEEIVEGSKKKEEARALEIGQNIGIVADDDLSVMLRGLLLDYEAEQRRGR